MIKFTKKMLQRLKNQGWEFSHENYYEYNQEEEIIYSNDKYPGVFISRSNSFGIYVYSDNLYNPESEKIIEAYNKGYDKVTIEVIITDMQMQKKEHNIQWSNNF